MGFDTCCALIYFIFFKGFMLQISFTFTIIGVLIAFGLVTLVNYRIKKLDFMDLMVELLLGIAVIEDCFIMDNFATHGAGGIGIWQGGTLHLYGSVINNNKVANNGGGIMNDNNAYVDDFSMSHITDNTPNNYAGKPYIPA